MKELRELTVDEISKELKDEDLYVQCYLQRLNKGALEIPNYIEIYEKYLEDFEEETGDMQPILTEKQIEEAFDRVVCEEQNTCDRCNGRGCNYCYMVGY